MLALAWLNLAWLALAVLVALAPWAYVGCGLLEMVVKDVFEQKGSVLEVAGQVSSFCEQDNSLLG